MVNVSSPENVVTRCIVSVSLIWHQNDCCIQYAGKQFTIIIKTTPPLTVFNETWNIVFVYRQEEACRFSAVTHWDIEIPGGCNVGIKDGEMEKRTEQNDKNNNGTEERNGKLGDHSWNRIMAISIYRKVQKTYVSTQTNQIIRHTSCKENIKASINTYNYYTVTPNCWRIRTTIWYNNNTRKQIGMKSRNQTTN